MMQAATRSDDELNEPEARACRAHAALSCNSRELWDEAREIALQAEPGGNGQSMMRGAAKPRYAPAAPTPRFRHLFAQLPSQTKQHVKQALVQRVARAAGGA